MESWSGTLGQDADTGCADDVAGLIERFLPAEYLECCDQWGDKAELDDLIERGQLPHPVQMRERVAEN
jgi:hypothetical protein